MPFDKSNYKIIRASDVAARDGIGVEIYRKGKFLRSDKFICEIFRDDTDRTRTVSLSSKEISLEELEFCIKIFREEIDWEFIEYED